MKRIIGFLLAVVSVLVSCSQKEIVPSGEEKPRPSLKSISVEQSNLVLSENGSASVDFSVKDPGFVFSRVILTLPDGSQPSDFSISRVDATAVHGQYVAMITDRGLPRNTCSLSALPSSRKTLTRAFSPLFRPIRSSSGLRPERSPGKKPGCR